MSNPQVERARQLAEDWHEGVSQADRNDWCNHAAGLLLHFADLANQRAEVGVQFDELVSAYREAVGIPVPHTDMWLLQAAAFRAALTNQRAEAEG